MPEGDSLRRVAERVRALEGEVLSVEAPHRRAAALGIAGRLDGKRLEKVEAVGKNLLLLFEGGLVLRSHLRMKGRWRVEAAGTQPVGTPWLVLRGRELQAAVWHGPVLELGSRQALERLGPDIIDEEPDLDGIIRRFRAAGKEREVGDALLDQRLVAGIGNMWKAEALFLAGVSPWRRLGSMSDEELRGVLRATALAMRVRRGRRFAYRRAGLPCRRCGATITSRPQGDGARTAYWCPGCQPEGGTETASA